MATPFETYMRAMGVMRALPDHEPFVRDSDRCSMPVIAPKYRTDNVLVVNLPAGVTTSGQLNLGRTITRVVGVQVKSINLSSGWSLGKDTYVVLYSDLAAKSSGQSFQVGTTPTNAIGGATLASTLTRNDGQENPIVWLQKPEDLRSLSFWLASLPDHALGLGTVPAGENITIEFRFICLPGEL